MSYAIIFLDNETCAACGEKSIRIFDRDNHYTDPMSKHSDVQYARCTNCGAEYFFMWDTETNTFRFTDKGVTIEAFSKKFVDTEATRAIDQFIQP